MNQSNKNQMEHFAKHGGTKFKTNVSADEINQYVNDLPPEKKDSMYEVMKQLESELMITIINDGILSDGEGEIGGSQSC
ncbi:hypothetical protein IC620_06530 [Hazenella sp. IB182357]|uniref:Uncharacterized protein n=1 Tax=Polycladospora coralii TaxID=2771432 RepID=A0A926RSW6_9BACL|nr:hypothetical protein [Polycladospora coralii]MBD1372015.1 hypothetical protein [Polycladospora coralii]